MQQQVSSNRIAFTLWGWLSSPIYSPRDSSGASFQSLRKSFSQSNWTQLSLKNSFLTRCTMRLSQNNEVINFKLWNDIKCIPDKLCHWEVENTFHYQMNNKVNCKKEIFFNIKIFSLTYTGCYGLNVCVLHKIYMLNLTPNVMVLGGWALGKQFGQGWRPHKWD